MYEGSQASSAIIQPLAQQLADDMQVPMPGVHMVGLGDRALGLIPLGPEPEQDSEAQRRLPRRMEKLTEVVVDAE